MPQAPRRTVFRQVLPSAGRPNFQRTGAATPDAFGASVGRALQGTNTALQQVSNVATRIQIEENEREAKELDVEFTQRKREILYGDGTEVNPGFYASKGENTVNQSRATREALDKLRAELIDRGSTESVKRLFGLSSSQRLVGDNEGISRYTNEQRQVASQAASNARIKEATDDAALSGWSDPDILNQSESIIENEVHSQAEDFGWSSEERQSKLEEARTLLYRNTIVSAIKNDRIDAAKELFDKHKGKMDGGVAAEVNEILNSADQTKQAQTITDEIMSTSTDAAEALAKARAVDDPSGALRDDVVNRVNRRLAENTKLTAQRTAAAESTASSFINSGGTLDQFQIANPEAYEVLKGDRTAMEGLRKAQDQIAAGDLFSRVSDGKTFSRLRRLEPTDLAEIDPEVYRSRLTEEEYGKLITSVAGAQESMQRNKESFEAYRRGDKQLALTAPVSFKWGATKQSSGNREIQNQIRADMNAFVNSYTSRGAVPTDAELFSEAQRLFSEVDVEGAGFLGILDDTMFVSQAQRLSPEERATVTFDLDDIPEVAVTEVKAIFNERGIVATDDLVEQYVGATLMNDQPRKLRLLGLIPSIGVPEIPVQEEILPVEVDDTEEAGQEQSTAPRSEPGS